MLYGKKKESVKVFALIYLVLFTLLAWVLFFNSGLDLLEGQEGKIILKNSTAREIKNAKVTAIINGSEIVLLEEQILSALQEVSVPTEKISGQQTAVLVAKAPFYQETRKTLFLGGGLKEIEVLIETPQNAFAGEKTIAGVQLCNRSTKPKTLTIEIVLENGFFEEQKLDSFVTVESGDCSPQSFIITPLKTGSGAIVFNIKGENYNESIEKILEVK
ncbi:MAG: hypothetical protein Q7K34_01920 [archaeon]|nr:hypothetical protein [archaeon]